VLGLDRFVMYAFDFGGPIGMRLATRHPEWIAGLIVQNANSYDEGLSELARATAANRPGAEGAEDNIRQTSALYRGPLTPVRTRACRAGSRRRTRWRSR
jgi:pimeloyl-ACP methyl ester carboxylesterase